MSKRIILALTAVLSAVFLAPLAASAAPYTPGAQFVASDYTVVPGQTVTVTGQDGFFQGGEAVTFTLTGEDGASAVIAAGVGSAPLAVEPISYTKTANAAGGVSASVTVPATAEGSYSVSGVSASASGSVTLTVVAEDDGLASTGYELPLALIWAVAGFVALGVALVVVRRTVRGTSRR